MDTSKEYIKMCIAATEIQDKWKPEVGDFYFDGKYSDVDVVQYSAEKLGSDEEDFGYWWLPRIDQLQEMCLDSWDEFYFEISDDEYGLKDYTKFPTVEQAGLACVMWWNNKKEWDGEKWS